jgi:hypothetical protein
MLCSRSGSEAAAMVRPDAKIEKVYFRKSIDGLAVLVEWDIKVAVFDPVLRLSQQTPQLCEDFLLRRQRLLPLAKTP